MFKYLISLTIAVILSFPGSSRGANIHESDNLTMDIDGNIKLFNIGLHMNWPPIALAAGLGWDSKSAFMGMGETRIGFSGAYKEDVFKWQLQLKGAFGFYSQPGLMTAMGGGLSSYEPSYLFPMQYTDNDDPDFFLSGLVDRAFFKFKLGKFDFIVGRQPIGLGVGYIWQPADLMGTFSPIEMDKEYKPGVDAIRINLSPGKFTEISIIGVAGGPPCRHISWPTAANPLLPSVWQTPTGNSCSPGQVRYGQDHSSAAIRARTTMKEWDFGILGGYVRGDLIAGLFTSGAIGKFNLKAEAVFTHDLDPAEAGDPYYSSKNNYVRAVAGFEYSFSTKKALRITGEVYYNGFGTTDPANYMDTLKSARSSLHGEVLNPGMFYAAFAAMLEASDKIKINFMTMANLLDPSFHLSLSLDFRLDDNSSVFLGGYLPIGEKPEILITPEGASLNLKSEFGLYPVMVFLQYKRYY
ncbi:hypothetical protein KKF34_01200 [Myxococcota bacterium]|nr:hypothetical protein [Myxococcota bacterium]MBU1382952.1 hypothetical protein [Myxococcota bacterium]MBU1495478.1 hypothetical protein [Myxococcota bacterium]